MTAKQLRLKESVMKEVKVFIDYVEGRGYSAVVFRAEFNGHIKEVVENIPYISYQFPELRIKAQNTVINNELKLDKSGFKFIIYGNGLPLKTTTLPSGSVVEVFDFGEEFSLEFKREEFKEWEDWVNSMCNKLSSLKKESIFISYENKNYKRAFTTVHMEYTTEEGKIVTPFGKYNSLEAAKKAYLYKIKDKYKFAKEEKQY